MGVYWMDKIKLQDLSPDPFLVVARFPTYCELIWRDLLTAELGLGAPGAASSTGG